MAHFARVIDREIHLAHNDRTVAKNVGVDTIELSFDAEWSACTSKVAVFKNGSDEFRAAVTGNTVEIPWEVLDRPGDMYLTIIGYVGESKRIVTEKMGRPYRVREAGTLAGERPTDPTPDAVQVLLSRAVSATDAANAAAARADAAQASAVNGESSRVSAENARKNAEAARVSAENARASAEALRVSAESGRVSAEDARSDAESARTSAESGRKDAESAREVAEVARVAEFDQMRQNFQGMQCVLLSDGQYDPETSEPTVDGDTSAIYYVPNPRHTVGDLYLEWRYLKLSDDTYTWELIGGRDKLPDAITVADIDAIVESGAAPKAERFLSLGGLAYLWAVIKEWFAAKVHKHDASDISSGVLPVERGGTGASTAAAAQYGLLSCMGEASVISGEPSFVIARPDASASAGAVLKVAGSIVWNWLDAKIRATFGFSSNGELPGERIVDGSITNDKLDKSLRDSLSRLRLTNCDNVYFAVTDKGAFFQFCDSDNKPIFGFSGIASGAVTAIDYRNQ